mmetsp:Transcript_44003/g.94273  ORF Transcript_44003/g.94273 Transcript_44003/m.94273 type:complete len:468 (-) Transcript_44003:1963-3366(-)
MCTGSTLSEDLLIFLGLFLFILLLFDLLLLGLLVLDFLLGILGLLLGLVLLHLCDSHDGGLILDRHRLPARDGLPAAGGGRAGGYGGARLGLAGSGPCSDRLPARPSGLLCNSRVRGLSLLDHLRAVRIVGEEGAAGESLLLVALNHLQNVGRQRSAGLALDLAGGEPDILDGRSPCGGGRAGPPLNSMAALQSTRLDASAAGRSLDLSEVLQVALGVARLAEACSSKVHDEGELEQPSDVLNSDVVGVARPVAAHAIQMVEEGIGLVGAHVQGEEQSPELVLCDATRSEQVRALGEPVPDLLPSRFVLVAAPEVQDSHPDVTHQYASIGVQIEEGDISCAGAVQGHPMLGAMLRVMCGEAEFLELLVGSVGRSAEDRSPSRDGGAVVSAERASEDGGAMGFLWALQHPLGQVLDGSCVKAGAGLAVHLTDGVANVLDLLLRLSPGLEVGHLLEAKLRDDGVGEARA